MTENTATAQTARWIESVVVGCNFCPFAAKALLKKSIRYVVWPEATMENSLEKLMEEMRYLDLHESDARDEAQMSKWVKQAAKLPGWLK